MDCTKYITGQVHYIIHVLALQEVHSINYKISKCLKKGNPQISNSLNIA